MSSRFRNWTGDVRWRPAVVTRVRTEGELVAAVRGTTLPIRVLGAGHSFNPLAATVHETIRLEARGELFEVDAQRRVATVWAGMRLRDLGQRLAEHGLAMENLGDIDGQTLAGALSTATHGTGIGLGCIASQVAGLTLITASGDALELEPERDGATFRAAAVSLGCLGVISRVRLRVREAFHLRDVRRTVPLDECLAQLGANAAAHRHFEFFWFPWTDVALTKALDVVPASEARTGRPRPWLDSILLDNVGLWLAGRIGRALPRAVPALNRFAARVAPEVEYAGPSRRIFPTPRHVRFQEVEYAVPAASGPDCLREIRELIVERRLPVGFPVEYRLVAGDELFLSPFHRRDSATISVMQFHPPAHGELFDGVEAIFRNHSGRPHWGKQHSARPGYLSRVHPRWNDFQRIRAELDPAGRFLNSYLRERLLGTG